ncbi:MAG TPA: hypothetical protein VM677_21285 [Actinokineospora sp.]|nr:hypothetical protein [Actinokineospora sp.]
MRQRGNKARWAIGIAYVLGALVAIVTNVATGVLPESWRPHLWIAWPVLGVLLIGGLVLALRAHRAEAGPVGADRAAFSRKAMLAQVRTVWIDGVLDQSLYQRTVVDLGLEERPDALRRPWEILLETADRESRPLPPGTDLVDLLHRTGGLLVLGAPGAGKTTVLLGLLRDLLDVAAEDPTAPIPVVFPLSSWTGKPLAEWLIDELTGSLYGIAPELAHAWVSDDRVLPLLDGLDEVGVDRRLACAKAIDEFHSTHRPLPVVVASRLSDYDALELRLPLGTALLIQPLSQDQVGDYLDQLGESLSGLRGALSEQPALWDLLRTPFLLNVAVRAYHGLTSDEVAASGAPRQSRLITAFIDRTLRRKPHDHRFAPADAIGWLAYTARSLGQDLRPFFYVESVTAAWLPERARRIVMALTTLPAALLTGTAVGLVLYLLFGTRTGVILGSLTGISFALGLWTADGIRIADVVRRDRRHLFDVAWVWLRDWFELGLSLCIAGALAGLVVGAVVNLDDLWTEGASYLGDMFHAMIMGAVTAVILAAFLALTAVGKTDWSAPHDRSSGAGVRIAATSGAAFFVIVGVPLTIVMGGVFGRAGVLVGVVLTCALTYLFTVRALASYWLTRFLLNRGGVTPRRQVAFLDFAVAHALMLKVGRGYLFAHRLLLEHFASLEPDGTGSPGCALPAIDLRPEAVLARAADHARAGGSDTVTEAVAYASSVLPAELWAPSALEIARTMRAHQANVLITHVEVVGSIRAHGYQVHVAAVLDVLLLVVRANHQETSKAAAVEFAHLLFEAEEWEPFVGRVWQRSHVLTAIDAVTPVAAEDTELGAEARVALASLEEMLSD